MKSYLKYAYKPFNEELLEICLQSTNPFMKNYLKYAYRPFNKELLEMKSHFHEEFFEI